MARPPKDPSPAYDPGQADDALEDDRDGDRVAKALARSGVASRREVERLIEAGRVALNGRVLTTPAVKVSPGDVLTVDGKPVAEPEPTRLWRYHKPVGLMTTHNDPQGRPTVFDALPAGMPRVISIGRLDLNSEGLLLLTNDGALARSLELPSTGWVRRYRARARGRTDQARLDRLKDGITVEGVRYGPIEARLDKVKESADGVQAANVWITVALTEGKNREVRRVLEALGLTVNRLIRQSYGPFQLGVLTTGQVEEIGPRVIREQLAAFIAADNMPKGDRIPAPAIRRAPASKAAASPVIGEGKDPKVYKPGWARAKPKAKFRGPPKSGSKAAAAKAGPASAEPAKIPGPNPRPSSPSGAAGARPERRGPPRSGKGR